MTHLLILLLWFAVPLAPQRPPQPIDEGRQPQAAVDNDGTVWLVYARGRTIWLRSSKDGGASFSDAVKVAEVPAMDLGMRRGPRIAVAEGALLVTCIAGEQARGRDGDLLLWRSTDGGRSWSEPRQLNSVAGSAREGLQATAAAGKYVAVVWLDMRQRGTVVYGAFSHDGGESFSQDRPLYSSPDGTVCECCLPQVAVDDRGRTAVMFRNALDGNRDMYLLKSTDGGESFGPARQQGEGHWLIHACPMDGGSLAINSDQVWMVWRRERDLYLTQERFDDRAAQPTQEQHIGDGENAWLTLDDAGVHMIYVKDGAVTYRRPGGQTQTLADAGEDPVLLCLPGRAAPLAFWEHENRLNAHRP